MINAEFIELCIKALPLIEYTMGKIGDACKNTHNIVGVGGDRDFQHALTTAPSGIGPWGSLSANLIEFARLGLKAMRINTYKQYTRDQAMSLAVIKGKYSSKDQVLTAMACIAYLYDNHTIERPAQIGGTLLQTLGREVYPEIHPAEERLFAIPVSLFKLGWYKEELLKDPAISKWFEEELFIV